MRKLTEEESYDFDTHLTSETGLRILGPIFFGIILIFIGINTLPLGVIAIVTGSALIVYGIYVYFKNNNMRNYG